MAVAKDIKNVVTVLTQYLSASINHGNHRSVLILGDGDFSFSRALVRTSGYGKNIVATSFDRYEELVQKYTSSLIEQTLTELKKDGVQIYHGVDATNLNETLPTLYQETKIQEENDIKANREIIHGNNVKPFEKIVFNFPHPGGKTNLKKSRKLLLDFFASAKSVLNPEGEILVSLAKGQGGTRFEGIQSKDSWQIVEMAAHSNFILTDCFKWENMQGYSSSGFRSSNRWFRTTDGLTHVFSHDDRGKIDLQPLIWCHDISLWILKEEMYEEEKLKMTVRDTAGSENIESIECTQTLRITPRDIRVNGTNKTLTISYRIMYRNSNNKALSRIKCRDLQLDVREKLADVMDGIIVVR